tara:strand:- start:823 stop:1389 length:567 start_codon:yes stop_codon:yes gene_type:complete
MVDQKPGISRRELLGAFAATAFVAAPAYTNAASFLRGAGNIRRIKMYSTRTGESLDMIYWIEGYYIKDALAEVNWFMRDWRQNKARDIDTRTVDIIAASQQLLDTSSPFLMLSGYRTPATNNLLRARSRNVAKNSLHMSGQAADLRMQGKSVRQIARAAFSCAAGGVGRYSRSNFVHLDCGEKRLWGK